MNYFFSGKLNVVNYRRLMKYHIDINNGINTIFIEMSKCVVSNVEIYTVTNKYKISLN